MSSTAGNQWLSPDRITNGYLQDLTQRFDVKGFLGVFPCDLLPKRLKSSECVIVNTHPHRKNGEHYVCVKQTNGGCAYFDPLCLDPTLAFPEMSKHLRIYAPLRPVLSRPVQHLSSKFCGLYCLDYLLSTTKGFEKMKREKYGADLLQNDYLCVQNVIGYAEINRNE